MPCLVFFQVLLVAVLMADPPKCRLVLSLACCGAVACLAFVLLTPNLRWVAGGRASALAKGPSLGTAADHFEDWALDRKRDTSS